MNPLVKFIPWMILLIFTNLYTLVSAIKMYKQESHQKNQEDLSKNRAVLIYNSIVVGLFIPAIVLVYTFIPTLRSVVLSFAIFVQFISTTLGWDLFSRHAEPNASVQRDFFIFLAGISLFGLFFEIVYANRNSQGIGSFSGSPFKCSGFKVQLDEQKY